MEDGSNIVSDTLRDTGDWIQLITGDATDVATTAVGAALATSQAAVDASLNAATATTTLGTSAIQSSLSATGSVVDLILPDNAMNSAEKELKPLTDFDILVLQMNKDQLRNSLANHASVVDLVLSDDQKSPELDLEKTKDGRLRGPSEKRALQMAHDCMVADPALVRSIQQQEQLERRRWFIENRATPFPSMRTQMTDAMLKLDTFLPVLKPRPEEIAEYRESVKRVDDFVVNMAHTWDFIFARCPPMDNTASDQDQEHHVAIRLKSVIEKSDWGVSAKIDHIRNCLIYVPIPDSLHLREPITKHYNKSFRLSVRRMLSNLETQFSAWIKGASPSATAFRAKKPIDDNLDTRALFMWWLKSEWYLDASERHGFMYWESNEPEPVSDFVECCDVRDRVVSMITMIADGRDANDVLSAIFDKEWRRHAARVMFIRYPIEFAFVRRHPDISESHLTHEKIAEILVDSFAFFAFVGVSEIQLDDSAPDSSLIVTGLKPGYFTRRIRPSFMKRLYSLVSPHTAAKLMPPAKLVETIARRRIRDVAGNSNLWKKVYLFTGKMKRNVLSKALETIGERHLWYSWCSQFHRGECELGTYHLTFFSPPVMGLISSAYYFAYDKPLEFVRFPGGFAEPLVTYTSKFKNYRSSTKDAEGQYQPEEDFLDESLESSDEDEEDEEEKPEEAIKEEEEKEEEDKTK